MIKSDSYVCFLSHKAFHHISFLWNSSSCSLHKKYKYFPLQEITGRKGKEESMQGSVGGVIIGHLDIIFYTRFLHGLIYTSM
jgi:hypothetical protein